KLKRYDEAAKNLERAYEIVDDDPTIISHLAEVYLAKHDSKSALELYRRVIKLDPDNKEAAEKIKKIKAESQER
ncbi:MAG: tetratricopeptide repeat protein, partial [Geobacter sp.]|nr:tetratricopeptide repeat protein [Geobacter sp.]